MVNSIHGKIYVLKEIINLQEDGMMLSPYLRTLVEIFAVEFVIRDADRIAKSARVFDRLACALCLFSKMYSFLCLKK